MNVRILYENAKLHHRLTGDHKNCYMIYFTERLFGIPECHTSLNG